MSSSGPKFPSTYSGSGWTNPENILTSNGNYASMSVVRYAGPSASIEVSNFGFNIPETATIDGFIVTIGAYSANGFVRESVVQLLDENGTPVGTNHPAWGWSQVMSALPRGTPYDDWDWTSTGAQVNSANFGVTLSIAHDDSVYPTTDIGYADYISITVYYTEVPNSSSSSTSSESSPSSSSTLISLTSSESEGGGGEGDLTSDSSQSSSSSSTLVSLTSSVSIDIESESSESSASSSSTIESLTSSSSTTSNPGGETPPEVGDDGSVVRLSDICTGHGCFPSRANITASINVYVNSRGAHRKQDLWAIHCCDGSCHPGSLEEGSNSVFVNSEELARVGDPITCGSICMTGSTNVFAGD